MFRARLNALLLDEPSGVPHPSLIMGKSHMCGHDGHTNIFAALGRQLELRNPPEAAFVDFRRELMEWMPPPDGIAMCQSGVR